MTIKLILTEKNMFCEVTVTVTLTSKSNQFILESKLAFAPSLKKNSLKIPHPQDWNDLKT